MHLRGVMMSASILCVVFSAETKVIKDVHERQGTIWSEDDGMDSVDENADRYLIGGQTNWKNLSHYEGSMNNTDGVERNGFPGGRTHWEQLPSDEGGTHNVDGVGESSFTGGQNGWASLPPEEDGPNHIDSEEERVSQEYYEHTVKATTDEYGRRCHERLFTRKIEEKMYLSIACTIAKTPERGCSLGSSTRTNVHAFKSACTISISTRDMCHA
uniref:Putative secreted protein n=1 Tax=Amblyomma triste TaxID=251400 RepID=A0A023G5I0_AMBTT